MQANLVYYILTQVHPDKEIAIDSLPFLGSEVTLENPTFLDYEVALPIQEINLTDFILKNESCLSRWQNKSLL